MRSHLVLAALAAVVVLCGPVRAASAVTIDGISASDLFVQHAYIRTDTGIYYGTAIPGGFRLNYVPNSDLPTVFLVLATGLKPYSPGMPGEHGGPGAAPPGSYHDGASTSHDDASGSSGPADTGSNDSMVTGPGFVPADPSAIPSGPRLVATPEPASAALALAGLAGLLVLRRSRTRRRGAAGKDGDDAARTG